MPMDADERMQIEQECSEWWHRLNALAVSQMATEPLTLNETIRLMNFLSLIEAKMRGG